MLFMGKSERARERERARASCVSGEVRGAPLLLDGNKLPCPKKGILAGVVAAALLPLLASGSPTRYARMVFVGLALAD